MTSVVVDLMLMERATPELRGPSLGILALYGECTSTTKPLTADPVVTAILHRTKAYRRLIVLHGRSIMPTYYCTLCLLSIQCLTL